MKNIVNKSTYISFLLLASAPAIIAVITRGLWMFLKKETLVFISLASMILNFFVNPLYLLFICYYFSNRNKASLLIYIPTCLIINVASILIQYWNWGTTTGLLKTPDSMTLMVVKLEFLISIAIFILGSIIILFLKSSMEK